MQKFEFIQKDVDELAAMVKDSKNKTTILRGADFTSTITIRRGEFHYTMGIIYAALLVEYMQEQLNLGNIVDVALYTTQEWDEIEEKFNNEG